MEDRIIKYIKDNWDNTVRQPEDTIHGMVRLPKPFTVPCAREAFTDFYYWDTYFTNLGLMLTGRDAQAENNLDNIKFFIDNLGYMPNANHLLDRSQPPLFTRGVYDLYKFRNDPAIIDKYIDAILRELTFFRTDRTVFEGLCAFGNNCTKQTLHESAGWLAARVGEPYATPEEGAELADELYSIAESGWDFNPRFPYENRRFAPSRYVHLDLNCLLYDAELKVSEMLALRGRNKEAAALRKYAADRKENIRKYMRDNKTGIYYDYDYKSGRLSPVLSCISFYPYALGIDDDPASAAAVLRRLELPCGISSCEYRGEDARYLQWDYPAMWPSNVYFTYTALNRTGLKEAAARIAGKYIDTARSVFDATGSLWEKYDAAKGAVSVTTEYETPAMLGWTAGVYLWLSDRLNGHCGGVN
jgi:alpha,alpha-trehalase